MAGEDKPTADRAALKDYVERLFAPEDAVLRELRREIQRRDLPQIYITPEQGKLLQVLLTAVGARHVLEIGTLAGYSSIWMARALPPDGHLVTLELEEAHAELARDFARRAGLDDVIEVRVGVAVESLRAIAREEGAPFDACFIDADKAGYPAYLRWARRLVRPGGLVLADNVFWSGQVLEQPPPDDDTYAIQQFNRRFAAADDGLCSTIIPVRDGLGIGVVLRKEDPAPGSDVPDESAEAGAEGG